VDQVVEIVAEVVVGLLQCVCIHVEVLAQHADQFKLQMVLLELDEPRRVLNLFVKAPYLVHENVSAKTQHVLLVGAEWKELVELFIIDYFVSEESVAQLNDCLLGPPDLGQQFDLHHFEHLEDDKGLDVGHLLSKVADERSLTDKVPRLLEMMVFECAKCAVHEVLDLLDVLRWRDSVELLLDFGTVLLW